MLDMGFEPQIRKARSYVIHALGIVFDLELARRSHSGSSRSPKLECPLPCMLESPRHHPPPPGGMGQKVWLPSGWPPLGRPSAPPFPAALLGEPWRRRRRRWHLRSSLPPPRLSLVAAAVANEPPMAAEASCPAPLCVGASATSWAGAAPDRAEEDGGAPVPQVPPPPDPHCSSRAGVSPVVVGVVRLGAALARRLGELLSPPLPRPSP